MRSHISVHRATTKYFSNSFALKPNIEKEGLPRDRTPDLGAGGLRFKSGRPDQKYLACILLLIESAVHLKPHLWNSGRQEVWIRKSCSFREFATWRICKNMRRQECYAESIERREVKRALFGKYGENSGDLTHFSPYRSSEMQISNHAPGSARASPAPLGCLRTSWLNLGSARSWRRLANSICPAELLYVTHTS
jgi:hypothetical protein